MRKNMKKIGGSKMYPNKGAGRIRLLASSSLVAAGLATGAFVGATSLATPAAAACTPTTAPTANDPGLITRNPDSYSCTGIMTGGVTYSSHGDLNVDVTGNLSVGFAGVNLTGNSTDNVTLTHQGFGTIRSTLTFTGVSGPTVDITSQSGAINVAVSNVSGAQTHVDYGISAVSTGGGAITINNVGGVSATSTNSLAAIRALTSGAVSITTDGSVDGRLRGILAEATGTAPLTITARNTVQVANGVAGSAAIEARTGIGLLRIDIDGSTASTTLIQGWGGTAILANAGGNAIIDVDAGRTVTGSTGNALSPALIDVTAVGSTTINNAGAIRTNLDELVVARISADSLALNNSGDLRGVLNLNGVTGNTIINNQASGLWSSEGGSTTFNGAADVLNSAGTLIFTGVTTFTGLETFNNFGVIYMGTVKDGEGTGLTNFLTTDRLVLNGGTFQGSGDGSIIMDVSFSGSQTDCSAAVAADCLQIVDGETAGLTLLNINGVDGTVSGSSSPIVVVDGSTAAGHFALDPASAGFAVTTQGEVLKRRLFGYRLEYDAENQNHYLIGVPVDETFQFSTFAGSAQEIWRATSGTWFDRQADLRATPNGLESGGALWARVGVGSSQRDARPSSFENGGAFANVSVDQRTTHLAFGADFLGASSARSAWVVGVTGGLVRSDADYETTATEVVYSGVMAGVYASYLVGPLFVDASVSANKLDANADMPTLGLQDEVQLTQTLESVGARLDAGWRMSAARSYFVEPLVSFAYVVTKQSDIVVPDGSGEILFDDEAASFRAGAGVRLGADTAFMGVPASFSVTGRYWNEFEGENDTTLGGTAPTAMTDAFTGSFTELTGSVNLFSGNGAVSGFLNVGGRFADEYSSLDTAVGVRFAW